MCEPPDLDRFGHLVARRLGLGFEERADELAEALRRRLAARGLSSGAYLDELESRGGPELGALAQELTVPETYFFRHRDQFQALREHALPDRMRTRAGQKRLRLLSAGCASGEEPYSLAILAREVTQDSSWDVEIIGVDLNPAALARAERGRYSAWALRDTPRELAQRWFRPDGRELVLNADVRGAVHFEQRNLAEDDLELWAPGAFDVVFCRNVLMYFTPVAAAALAARLAEGLAPGGYLFLGHAETLRGLSRAFHLVHTHETFYYQRKPGRAGTPVAALRPWRQAAAGLGAGPALRDDTTWVEAIRGASERVEALTAGVGVEPETFGPPPAGIRWDLDPARELLRRERFSEALDLVHALPADSGRDPDVLLLRAALHVHGGQLDLAERACRRLLELDDLSAGAHYLLALCREGAGDTDAAAHHDQVAAYLDPTFAMPRLHLGLLARRAGDREAARRDLSAAADLLEREDPSRLLLFGGGFGREALIAVCRAELQACGGPA